MEKQDKSETWYHLAARSPEERSKRPAPSPSLEQAKIQAQVLVPVLRAFREAIGAERANKIAWGALAEWRQQVWRSMLTSPGTPTEQFRASTVAMADIIGDAVDVEMLKDEPESLEFNVTGCRFAQFFHELGEP
ncbi:MAG TPA: L-2-amino-thiazoline-4-carboxylic acid hydrolase, partial [Candidatus Acidoferrales bacterium]|nr:L-2-amino-thiazoline-4-carboxylic acid hydrolase [Candidatus Acidoferrales bacterium]